jgi:predicted nucleic acid-binding protein
VKLVQSEPESEALRGFLRRHHEDERVTSAVARVEVVRAVQATGSAAVAQARRQLGRLHQITLDNALLDNAAALAPGTSLRSLDAVHLASARLVGAQLRSVVTYDRRMADAAADLGLPVDAPS